LLLTVSIVQIRDQSTGYWTSYIAFYLHLSAKMGCGMSTEDREGKVRNEEIENQLKRDKLSQRNEIKMLLLGAEPEDYLRR
jgi:hypothetical protein